MKTKTRIASLALSLMLTSGAALADLKIGVSMSQFDDTWLTYLRESMDKKAKSLPDGVHLQFEDARDRRGQATVARWKTSSARKSTRSSSTRWTPPRPSASPRPPWPPVSHWFMSTAVRMIRSCRRAWSPWPPMTWKPAALRMQYLADKMGGKGDIVILLGDLAGNSTANRTKGVKECWPNTPTSRSSRNRPVLLVRDKGATLVNDWLTQGREFQAVVSNNDEMAIGAAMALKQAGTQKGSVLIAGVDGTPDGLNAIKKGEMAVSVFQDAKGQADGSIDTAVKMVKKQPVEQSVWVHRTA